MIASSVYWSSETSVSPKVTRPNARPPPRSATVEALEAPPEANKIVYAFFCIFASSPVTTGLNAVQFGRGWSRSSSIEQFEEMQQHNQEQIHQKYCDDVTIFQFVFICPRRRIVKYKIYRLVAEVSYTAAAAVAVHRHRHWLCWISTSTWKHRFNVKNTPGACAIYGCL